MSAANKLELNELLDIMVRLRDPQSGCPWDKEQNFNTIAPYTIEEAYEVADAIERQDWDDLRDELGDLFFQVVYHSRMAEEAGYFDFSQVLRSISAKLVRRHPHVFKLEDTHEEVDALGQKKRWEALKIKERASRDSYSLMDDIPVVLPAMERAIKIQKRAALVGFDWQDTALVLDKIVEEAEELRIEIEQQDQPKMQAELGDLMFAVVNLARHLKIDPAAALRQTNSKFSCRFRAMEELAGSAGMQALSLEQQEALWQAVKNNETD
ncbi:MAG: nucleoside triphosphate pyrophosphohydrolase [Xanthomonadales bacterium]|nr:nucleoside triphosphate pyrophosphohydrolase [Xanthomonadales bacterium]